MKPKINKTSEQEEMIAALRAENTALRERVATMEQMINHSPASSLPSQNDIPATPAFHGELQHPMERLRYYSYLVESVSDAVVSTDLEFRIVSWNRGAEKLYGWHADEVIGKHTDMLQPVYPESRERIRESFWQQRHWEGEVQQTCKDGRAIIVMLFVSLLRNDKGQPIGIVGINHDITDRKCAEKALNESQALLQSILTSAPTGIGLVHNRVIGWSNERLHEITGYSCDELYGQNARLLYPTDEEFERVGRIKYEQIRLSGTGMVETHWRRKDGKMIDILLSSTPINPDDISQGVTFTALDITKRKQVEQALRTSEERYKQAVTAGRVGIWEWDLATNEMYLAPELKAMLGYADDEIRNHLDDWGKHVHPDDQEKVMVAVEAYFQGKTSAYEVEHRMLHKDGSIRWFVARGAMQCDEDGTPVRMSGTDTDITERKNIEDAYRMLTENSLQGLALLQDNRIVFANPMMAEIMGYDNEELLEFSAEELKMRIHPDDREKVWSYLQNRLAGRTPPSHYEQRLVRKNGEVRWVETSADRVYYRDRPASQVVCLDITERKETEQHLRESEAKYRMLAEHMRDVIWTMDTTGRFTYMSPSIYHLRGYTPEEVMQQDLHEVVTPDSLHLVQEGMQRSFSGTATIGRTELEQPCKDGTSVWTESVVVRMLDDSNQVTGWLGVTRDIRDRRRAEEQMRQYAARAETLARTAARLNAQLELNTILEAVCEITQQALHTNVVLIFLYDKPSDTLVFARQVGLPPEIAPHIEPIPFALMDKDRTVIVIPDTLQHPSPHAASQQMIVAFDGRSMIRVLVRRDQDIVGMILAFTTGSVRSFTEDEQLLMCGIGDQAAQAIANARLFDEIHQERALLSQRVAERTADLIRSNTELARALKTKDEFLANMSHELRTPLNVILGLSESLQEEVYGPLNPRQRKSLATIESSGQHLLSLINDILDLSKIEAGKIELERTYITIETICQVSLQFIRQQALKKHISVSYHIDTTRSPWQPDIPETLAIYADERRLKQILINLLINAVKFTPEGGKVGLDVYVELDNRMVRFTVWDTGIGIAPDDQERLFQPFIQVDSSLSREYEGTGLGLALVLHLSQLHGGSVSLESEVGKGSRFTVSLPQDRPTHSFRQSHVSCNNTGHGN